MRGPSPSLELVPPGADHRELVKAARGCHACALYRNATQTVFGEGPVPSRLMLVGEQPGDQEDKQGHVFVGPAGRVLDDLLEAAGLTREQLYMTNAVKHFKWTPRGKRRLHARPIASEVHACHGWLEAELHEVRPKVVVCLGATAAAAFFGSAFKLTQHLGEVLGSPWAKHVVATYHPSALLRRMGDDEAYAETRKRLLADLKTAARLAKSRTAETAGRSRLLSAGG